MTKSQVAYILIVFCIMVAVLVLKHRPKEKPEKTWYPDTDKPYMQNVTIEYISKGQKFILHAKEMYIDQGMKNETNHIQSETTR